LGIPLGEKKGSKWSVVEGMGGDDRYSVQYKYILDTRYTRVLVFQIPQNPASLGPILGVGHFRHRLHEHLKTLATFYSTGNQLKETE
jgi:hypothetical protein